MKVADFLEARRENWRELENLCGKLERNKSRVEPQAMLLACLSCPSSLCSLFLLSIVPLVPIWPWPTLINCRKTQWLICTI